jgi:hypothetical protein
LKRGIVKYKGMFPLKCFNCGKIGYFANKCPYAKKSDNDEEEDLKKEKKYQKGNMKEEKRKVFKKNIYSREDSSSFDEDDESDSDSEIVLFMATKTKKITHGGDKEEGEVDIAEELISSLTKFKKEMHVSYSGNVARRKSLSGLPQLKHSVRRAPHSARPHTC